MIPTQTLREILRKFRNSPPIGGEIPGKFTHWLSFESELRPETLPVDFGTRSSFCPLQDPLPVANRDQDLGQNVVFGRGGLTQGIRGQEFWLQVLVDEQVDFLLSELGPVR